MTLRSMPAQGPLSRDRPGQHPASPPRVLRLMTARGVPGRLRLALKADPRTGTVQELYFDHRAAIVRLHVTGPPERRITDHGQLPDIARDLQGVQVMARTRVPDDRERRARRIHAGKGYAPCFACYQAARALAVEPPPSAASCGSAWNRAALPRSDLGGDMDRVHLRHHACRLAVPARPVLPVPVPLCKDTAGGGEDEFLPLP